MNFTNKTVLYFLMYGIYMSVQRRKLIFVHFFPI